MITKCQCGTCFPYESSNPLSIRMILCQECGNKRCPKAQNHRFRCKNSNEPNQIGEIEMTASNALKECDIASKLKNSDIQKEVKAMAKNHSGKVKNCCWFYQKTNTQSAALMRYTNKNGVRND